LYDNQQFGPAEHAQEPQTKAAIKHKHRPKDGVAAAFYGR
jgi:hypothetical protein